MRNLSSSSSLFFIILSSFILISIPTSLCAHNKQYINSKRSFLQRAHSRNLRQPLWFTAPPPQFRVTSHQLAEPLQLAGPTIHRSELVGVVVASSPTSHSPTPVNAPPPPFNVPAEVPGPTVHRSEQAGVVVVSSPTSHSPTPVNAPPPLFNVPAEVPVPFSKRNWRLIIAIGIPTSVVGILVISTVIICMFKRGHLSCNATVCWKGDAKNNHTNAEEFIKNYGSIVPRRYTYSEVKKLTNSLKEKIGQGGFGAVYKGQLPDGRMVAVKVLKESNGNGEEFINEVASISRTSHVNVVALLGFCYERNKRALIYEFMSNGSLNKFIYDERNRCLDRNTMFQISVGIARGLEYLHCGCRTRILHFDIKPHNILLDEDLCPKISDFGLAKLCKIKESIVSMTGMRGTVGYIAPEVFYPNFGGVSHKSDVYSYGMLVLEMIGGRKNFDGEASHTSELYFPHWVYKKLELGESFGAFEEITEEEEDTLKKMMIVSLWCIETNPRNRPSMSKVIEMLEGTLQSLQLPPQPFLDSPRRSPQNSF
ncbi:hypothetical protein ACB094_01G182700 [Castanea mollissima]